MRENELEICILEEKNERLIIDKGIEG